jgi:acyl dehydratase
MPIMKLQELQASVGQVIGTSDWFLIDQDRINKFADTTDDHQFIHVDVEAAMKTPFGGTFAHGFLTLSLLPSLMNQLEKVEVQITVNYGFNKMRFLSPVKTGKRVRGHFKLLELEEKRPGQWQQITEVTIEIEGEDKPALIAEWILQHYA